MSGSRSSSVSNAVVSLPADSPEAIGGPSKLSREDKDLLLEYLGIDCELRYLEPAGLPSSYQKYKAITEATPRIIALSKDQEWKQQFGDGRAWVPNIVDFINIFIAKSQFYQVWRPLFLQAALYPDMTAWLDQRKDRLSSRELWGDIAKQAITFVELKKWLKEKDREAEVKKYEVKGKKKASPSSSKPKPKPKKPDDRDKALVKRKHKKIMSPSDSDEDDV